MKKNTNARRLLPLGKETVKKLNDQDLKVVAGGGGSCLPPPPAAS